MRPNEELSYGAWGPTRGVLDLCVRVRIKTVDGFSNATKSEEDLLNRLVDGRPARAGRISPLGRPYVVDGHGLRIAVFYVCNNVPHNLSIN